MDRDTCAKRRFLSTHHDRFPNNLISFSHLFLLAVHREHEGLVIPTRLLDRQTPMPLIAITNNFTYDGTVQPCLCSTQNPI